MSLTDKIKKQFQITKKPEDWDLEFDICMKCGRRLEDKKYSTWKKHQDNAHKQTIKEKRKMFIAKHPILTVIGAMVLFMVALPFISPTIDNAAYELNKIIDPNTQVLNSDQLIACEKQMLTFKQNVYKEKDFSNNDLQTLKDLTTNCNMKMYVSQVGPSLFKDNMYDTSTNPTK